MMDKHKQDLLDQIDDAAFALMMDAYAEEEGARLLREFEEAVPHEQIPESLDKKCRRLIDAEFSHERWRARVRKVLQMASKAAMITLAVLAISVAMVMSVEALREPVLKYFVETLEKSTLIRFDQNYYSSDELVDPLGVFLPEGFTQVEFDNDDGLIYSAYEHVNGSYAVFSMTRANGEYHFSDPDGNSEERMLRGYRAFYVRTEEWMQMVWISEETQIIYMVTVSGISEEEFLEICNILAVLADDYYEKAQKASAVESMASFDPLEGMLPDEFRQLTYDNLNGMIHVLYGTENDWYAALDMTSTRGSYFFDSENADCTEMEYHGYQAFHVKKDDLLRLIWIDEENEIIYSFYIMGASESEFWDICSQLVPTMDAYAVHIDDIASLEADPADRISNPLAGLLPGDYEVMKLSGSDWMFHITVRNQENQLAALTILPSEGEFRVDSDGEPRETTLQGHHAFVFYSEVVEVVWIDEAKELMAFFWADGMSEEEVLAIAEQLAADLPLPPYEVQEETAAGIPMVSAEELESQVIYLYEQVSFEADDAGMITASYQNKEGRVLYFEMTSLSEEDSYTIPDAVSEEIVILDYPGMLYTSEYEKRIVWIDEANGVRFSVRSDHEDIDEFIIMCKNLAIPFYPGF